LSPRQYFGPAGVSKFKDAVIEFTNGFNCVTILRAIDIAIEMRRERAIDGAPLLLLMKCLNCPVHFHKIQRQFAACDEWLRAPRTI
jgi:hypothetical protein